MVDNIEFNKILPSLSPASKVNRVDARGRNSPQSSFQQRLAREPKKKKRDDSEQDGEAETKTASSAEALRRKRGEKTADRSRRSSSDSAPSKLIDIRV